MLSFFKRKKKLDITINCTTNSININNKDVSFPTNHDTLVELFGKPTRQVSRSKEYSLWDNLGILCSYVTPDRIVSINFFQNKKDSSEFNTKKQFKGKIFLIDEEITNNEFHKIALEKYAIHRLGRETEIRFGFSVGLNNEYKNGAN